MSAPKTLVCDDCGCRSRRPAIDLCLGVLCTRCCTRHGMFPGEHGCARTYDEWKVLAARWKALTERQATSVPSPHPRERGSSPA